MNNRSSRLNHLPKVDRVLGLGYSAGSARMQYESDGQVYEIEFPLPEVFMMEEYFILLRREIGPNIR